MKKSTLRNLKEMGLASDPNKAVKIPNYKQEQLKRAKKMVSQESSESEEEVEVKIIPKKEIVEKLEKEARAPRQRRFMYVFLFLFCFVPSFNMR